MDTSPVWDISGPVFLVGFALAVLLSTAFAVRARNRAREQLPVLPELRSYALAPLGPRSAWEDDVVAASLVFLRSKGLVEVEADGTLRTTGDGEGLTDPLDRTVLQAVAQGAAFEDLSRNYFVGEAIAHLAREYRDWEAEAPAAYFARMRRTKSALLPLGLLIPVGAAWLWAGAARGEHAGVLLLLLLSLEMEAAVLALWWVPRLPPSDLEERLRQRNLSLMQRRLQELRSATSRDGADTGAAEAVLEMVFFGQADLEAVDPELHAVLRAAARRREAEAVEARHREAEAAEARRREAEARRAEIEAHWKEREARREKPRNGSGTRYEEPSREAREEIRRSRQRGFTRGSSYGGVYDGPSFTGSSSTDDGGDDSGSTGFSSCSIGCSICGSAINCT